MGAVVSAVAARAHDADRTWRAMCYAWFHMYADLAAECHALRGQNAAMAQLLLVRAAPHQEVPDALAPHTPTRM